MADIALPLTRFSAETHLEALEGLVQRYEHENSPIHYKKAAIDINESTCSSCLRYFGDIGLIHVEKQGVYVPSDPVIDFFTKVGQARENAVQDINELLKDDPVFSEVTFHIDEDEAELEDLAQKVAGTLEINRDDIGQLKRAIEIYAELEILTIDEDDKVTLPDERGPPDSSEREEDQKSETADDSFDGTEESSPALSDIDPKELELPPPRGYPESLHQLCLTLKQKGQWTVFELAEENESSERTVRRILRYGDDLGFISRTEGKITLTERGYDLGFEPELNDSTNQHFINAVLEYDFYCLLLSRCLDRIDIEAGESALKTSDCEHELRTYFGFTDESQETLRRAINTFLQTIEGTGHGEYIVGSGESETRLELERRDVEDLNDIIRTGFQEKSPDKTQPTEEESEPEETPVDELEPKAKGPPLRISSFRIQNFRNIRDSGDISLENITTFIGKNESGKTSTLEAIASFDHSTFYLPQDICNDTVSDYEIESDGSADIPVVTLRFEITEEIIDTFYDDGELDEEDLPVTVEVTKYADGHFENNSSLDISEPSPDIVYYNRYDIISDALYFDEDEDERNDTFQNLLEVGELTEEDIVGGDPADRHQAIEHAENLIERHLNKAWSQKDVRINLRYEGSENCLYLYIQDDLEEERPFTSPSQRSEGFQWFFSFYINLIAETDTDEDGYKILLLDDPAVHLHPSGKQDWLDSLEEIAREDQVLYTSHSPYLINKRHPSRIRTVEDSPEGTQINSDVFDADTGTLEPLRNALGVDLSSSPFVSEGQVLVEGPSEYYILSAVGGYFDRLGHDFFDWNKVSLMPVRGANDVIGKASWLESEDLEYVILLDSDNEGQGVENRISNHHEHIDDDRVILLSKLSYDRDVVIEDMFDPVLYVDAFNEFYEEFTEDFEHDFEPVSIEEDGHNQWQIGREEYEGQRIDEVLVRELERQDVANELRNDDGDIELMKRQVAEIISDRINNNQVDPDDLSFFNPIFGEIDTKLELS